METKENAISLDSIYSKIRVNASMGTNLRVMAGYTFVYTVEGAAHYRNIDGLECDIGPGDLIFVFPNYPHNYNPQPNSDWKQIYFAVDGPMMSLWQNIGYIKPAKPIHHAEPVKYWFNKFQNVHKKLSSPHSKSSLTAILQLQLILAEIMIAEESNLLSEYDLAWAQKACELLDKNSLDRKSMLRVAQKMNMSYELFRKRFKRIIGISPTQYQNRRVIELANQMMRETDLSNKEIAYQLGFCDEFHFSHRFKQITGRSPRDYRRTWPT